MGKTTGNPNIYFLMCERAWIYNLLIAVAGFFGAYTFLLKGSVFCNATDGKCGVDGIGLRPEKMDGSSLLSDTDFSVYDGGVPIRIAP